MSPVGTAEPQVPLSKQHEAQQPGVPAASEGLGTLYFFLSF